MPPSLHTPSLPPDEPGRPSPSARRSRRVVGGVLSGGLALLLGLPLLRRCAPAPGTPPLAPASPPGANDPVERRLAPDGPPPSAADLLLAPDGNPRSDVRALSDLVGNYLVSEPPSRRPALAFNEDFVRALSGPRVMGDAALGPRHPAVSEGRLLDRWGTPWFFHPLSAEQIEVRSAGPDRTLFTDDDLSSLDP